MPVRLDDFPSVLVDGVEIVVDQERPVAALIAPEEARRFVTWPDLDVGTVSPDPTLLPARDGVWVHYPPGTVSQMDDSHAEMLRERDSPAVHIAPDGSLAIVRTGTRTAIGASRGRLWTAAEREHVTDDAYRGGAMPAGWEDPTVLIVHHLDGTESTMRVDRDVRAVFEDKTGINLLVLPTPPIAHPDADGTSVSYEYRLTTLTLPNDRPLPDRVRLLDQHPDGIGPAMVMRRVLWRAHEWSLPAAPDRSIDLTDVDGSQWKRITLSPDDIEAASQAALRWYGDPNHYWHSEDGTTGPLETGMRDAEVHLEQPWPDTRVVITFAFPYWPEGRLRRAVRVFDDAGRLTVNPYADINLMEDLATGHLPPREHAQNGYLDV